MYCLEREFFDEGVLGVYGPAGCLFFVCPLGGRIVRYFFVCIGCLYNICTCTHSKYIHLDSEAYLFTVHFKYLDYSGALA